MMGLLEGATSAKVAEFAKKNTWAVVLALAVALVYLVGDVIVRSIAYFQPKVTINNIQTKQSHSRDNSVTNRHEIVRPDGTRELFEHIQTKLDIMELQQNQALTVKEPVALATPAKLYLLPGLGYEPVDKRWSLMLGVELGAFQAGLMHEVVTMHPDQARFPDGFRPMVWAAYRWGVGR